MDNRRKSRAFSTTQTSGKQLVLPGFESPFERALDPDNRWVRMAHLIPWDEICPPIDRLLRPSNIGRPAISARVVIGSLIIKYICNFDDRDTVAHIRENVYMQYFLGDSGFLTDKPFDASLFVDFRKKLGLETINAINEKIVFLKSELERQDTDDDDSDLPTDNQQQARRQEKESTAHNGKVIVDATCCPQDIAYPTDLNLLSDSREKAEELIDFLYDKNLHGAIKPRTYREEARKAYLQTAQKKKKGKKAVGKAVGKQLRYLRRDISILQKLLDRYPVIPFDRYQLKYFYVIQTLYVQQKEMYDKEIHTIEDRIVSIHQPHVRPIVRGKEHSYVEFGSKIHVSMIEGISFLDEISWDAFNEGSHLETYVESYKKRFGFYPKEVLADKIYCTRANRAMLKSKGIILKAKPLGRPSASALSIHVSPGERNPIEGKFGQAKTAYGLNRVKARLKDTSQSWIAGIFLVLNLINLMGQALVSLIEKVKLSLTAWLEQTILLCRKFSGTLKWAKQVNVLSCC